MMVRTELTLDDLEQMPDDAMHRELIDGELIELPPPGIKHSKFAMNIAFPLQSWVGARRLGQVFIEAGYKITADRRNWVQPDVSFVNADALNDEAEDEYAAAPGLAVEVISPSERPKHILAKRDLLFQAGCKEIWIVRPKTRGIEVWTTPRRADRELHEGDTLPSPLFGGWSMPVEDVFVHRIG